MKCSPQACITNTLFQARGAIWGDWGNFAGGGGLESTWRMWITGHGSLEYFIPSPSLLQSGPETQNQNKPPRTDPLTPWQIATQEVINAARNWGCVLIRTPGNGHSGKERPEKPPTMAHICNSSIWEAEPRKSCPVWAAYYCTWQLHTTHLPIKRWRWSAQHKKDSFCWGIGFLFAFFCIIFFFKREIEYEVGWVGGTEGLGRVREGKEMIKMYLWKKCLFVLFV